MYTLQALWTMVRERLDVIAIVFSNHSYAILNVELARTGAKQAGPMARSQLSLANPDLDFVALSQGMGVPAVRADTCEAFTRALQHAIAHPGPHLIEAVVPVPFAG
jgi:acetolactate synthase-1/2/3 large subunit